MTTDEAIEEWMGNLDDDELDVLFGGELMAQAMEKVVTASFTAGWEARGEADSAGLS